VERAPAAASFRLELRRDIVVEGERRSHTLLLLMTQRGVNAARHCQPASGAAFDRAEGD
jgi:hypothetical protein